MVNRQTGKGERKKSLLWRELYPFFSFYLWLVVHCLASCRALQARAAEEERKKQKRKKEEEDDDDDENGTKMTSKRFGEIGADEKRKLSTELQELELQRDNARSHHQQLQRECHQKFHAVWGQLMKTGYQNSRFAHQVERFACLYTSKVSNMASYSPDKYYRPSEDFMPHEFDILPL